jgi:gliding motility-associated-like protein
LGFPKFVTPNGDGYNDTWLVQGLGPDYSNASRVHIYDRYGKLLKQMSAKGNGWDGTFNGNGLPSSDYWFVAELVTVTGEVKLYKNHFSLKR